MPVDITEIDDFGASKVSGVGSPANGTPWLLLKAEENGIQNDNPDAGQTTSSEADAIEDELTKACGDESCGVCGDALSKGKLKAKERNALADSDFALPGRKYPIHDKSHARNALSRVAQNGTSQEKAKVRSAVHSRYPDIDSDAKKGNVEKSPGVPDESVATPKEGGHVVGSGESGVTGPATDGLETPPEDPSFSEGGASTYKIPAEAKANSVKNPKAPPHRPHSEAMKTDDSWSIEVTGDMTKGNWLSLDNPLGEASSDVGSPEWEDYDAASLDSIARGLTAAIRAVGQIAQREATEAVSGNPSDWFDALDLECAAWDINQALGLVARLAYHEAAAGSQGVKKEESSGLLSAINHLTKALGDGASEKTAGQSTGTESEEMMTTVTKEELVSLVKDAANSSVAEAMNQVEKARKKAAKAEKAKAAKKAKKQVKKEAKALFAAKNANNDGDVTAGEMAGAVHGHVDAEDIDAIPSGGNVDGQYANKAKKEKQIIAVQKRLAKMEERVEKAMSRPRSGGPVLDGIFRGTGAVNEGRAVGGNVAKSEEDAAIDKMRKELDETTDPAVKASIGQALTLAQLRRAHEQGLA